MCSDYLNSVELSSGYLTRLTNNATYGATDAQL